MTLICISFPCIIAVLVARSSRQRDLHVEDGSCANGNTKLWLEEETSADDSIEEVQQTCATDVDLSLVSIDVRRDSSEMKDSVRCVLQLFYGSNVVHAWYGLCDAGGDGRIQDGICDAHLSEDKATLTLLGVDGVVEISVLEFVEGALLGVGCPEPPRSQRPRFRRRKAKTWKAGYFELPAGDADKALLVSSEEGEDLRQDRRVQKVASPCRSRRA